MKPQKKGQALNAITGLAIGVAALVIAMAVMFLVGAQTKTQVGELECPISLPTTSYNITVGGCWNTSGNYGLGTASMNGTNSLISAAADLPDWAPLIIIASIGAILLGLVAMFRRSA